MPIILILVELLNFDLPLRVDVAESYLFSEKIKRLSKFVKKKVDKKYLFLYIKGELGLTVLRGNCV